jgi:hypothetical protein
VPTVLQPWWFNWAGWCITLFGTTPPPRNNGEIHVFTKDKLRSLALGPAGAPCSFAFRNRKNMMVLSGSQDGVLPEWLGQRVIAVPSCSAAFAELLQVIGSKFGLHTIVGWPKVMHTWYVVKISPLKLAIPEVYPCLKLFA